VCATSATGGTGRPEPTPENDTPPPARTEVRSASTCSYAVNPTQLSFGASAQTSPAAIATRAGCGWTAQSDSAWLSAAAGGGAGNATLMVTALANAAAEPRVGTITIGGAPLIVVQSGAAPPNSATACSNFRLQREGDQIPGGGLTGPTSVAVFADGQCGWQAQSNVNWISLTAGGAGSGNGTISYVALPNPDVDARSASVTVGGKRFVINQLGRGSDSGSGGSDGGGDSGGSSGGDSGGSSGGGSG
jgi:hypothetical protein